MEGNSRGQFWNLAWRLSLSQRQTFRKLNWYSVNAKHGTVEGKRGSVKLKPTFSLGFANALWIYLLISYEIIVTGPMKLTVFAYYNNMSFSTVPCFYYFFGFIFWSTKITFYRKAESVKLPGLQVQVDNSVVVYYFVRFLTNLWFRERTSLLWWQGLYHWGTLGKVDCVGSALFWFASETRINKKARTAHFMLQTV